jgi:hypothetical protein
MTGIQRVFVFSVAASATVSGGWAMYRGVVRVQDAARTVAERHRADPAPVPLGTRMREIAREAWSPTMARRDGVASPFGAPVPDSLRANVPEYDPATVADLRREGIDLASINEIRRMMRTALTAGDPAEKMKMALELKRRFNLEARPDLLGKLDRVGGAERLTLTGKGRAFVRGVVDSVKGLWGRVLADMDR